MSPSASMEAHFVACKGLPLKSKAEKVAPPAPPLPLQQKVTKSLLSRFGSQAQAFFSPKKHRFGSSVAIHKLRETKWFKHEEQGVLLAVVESGFIVEIKADPLCDEESQIPQDYHAYGVAVWKKGKGMFTRESIFFN